MNLADNADEIIAIGVVLGTMTVAGYQAVRGQDITIPTEPAMIVLGFYFGRKK
ncbi:MAG: hypothetical protein KAJ03_04315 [Gammaproteobacteria bacterium]|nr:hypothetical protein [Gammaproteobacteria bacterium]